jgi:putative oxidoreductase
MNVHRFSAPVLSLFRIVVSALFICHGVASVFGVLGGNHGSGHAVPFGTWPGWWAAAIQIVCGTLLLVGLLSRPAAVLSSGSMAFAYFTVHAPQGFFPILNGGEAAAMFCWSFFLVAVFGPGSWALDTLLRRGRSSKATAYTPATAEV